MKRTHYILFALTLLVAQQRCTPREQLRLSDRISTNYPLVFSSTQDVLKDKNIHCYTQLRAKESGDTLNLVMVVNNKSADTLYINPGSIQIETSNSLRSDAVGEIMQSQHIAPYTSDTLQFQFAPLTSVMLYEKIGYRGDMDASYSVHVNFIETKAATLFNQRIGFTLEQKDYSNYWKRYGKTDKIKTYRIKDRAETKTDLVNARATQSTQTSELAKSIEVTHTHLAIEGCIVKLNLYTIIDSLFLRVTIINHSQQMYQVYPAKFAVQVQSDTLLPTHITVNSFTPTRNDIPFVIPKGARFQEVMQFGKVESRDEITVICKAIMKYKTEQPIVVSPIHFVKDTNTPTVASASH